MLSQKQQLQQLKIELSKAAKMAKHKTVLALDAM